MSTLDLTSVNFMFALVILVWPLIWPANIIKNKRNSIF